MCVLCGELMSTLHWSDANFKNKESTIVVGSLQGERMRLRLKKVKIANIVLEFYGLSLKEWQGSKFILEDKKGQRVIVNDLGDLWTKAEAVCKKPLDILDAKLMAFIQTKTHG